MSHWKRMKSGEQDDVLQYWTEVEDIEEIIIIDIRENSEYKGNYAAFTLEEEQVGLYVEESDVLYGLYEDKGLFIEGSLWRNDKGKFRVIDANPREKSSGNENHPPEDTVENCVYVEYTDSDKNDWVDEEELINSLELVEAGL